MPWGPAPLFQLVIPEDAGPNDPQIDIGPELPAELLAKYNVVANNTPDGGILFRQDAGQYTYYINTPQLHAVGSADDNPGPAIVVNELYRTSSSGTTAEQVYGEVVPGATNDYTVTFGIGNGASRVTLDTLMQVDSITGATLGRIVIDLAHVCAASEHTAQPGVAGTTTSAAFANLPGSPGVTIDKAYPAANTKLVARVSVTMFAAVANSAAAVAVNVNGADVLAVSFHMNVVGSRYTYSGEADLTGLPAGNYPCTLRWRRVSGAGTITHNTDDWVSITVEEVTAT